MDRTRRVILVGTDAGRLLALAAELEARGLEVALYRELERGLTACAAGQVDVLVAIGRLAPVGDGPVQPVPVPLVLLDAIDAPELPLRPTGPCTALGSIVGPRAAADRVLALAAPGPDPVVSGGIGLPAAGGVREPLPARTAVPAPHTAPTSRPPDTRSPGLPATPEVPAPRVASPARGDLAALRETAAAAPWPPDSAEGTDSAPLPTQAARPVVRVLLGALLAIVGVALAFGVGVLVIALTR